MPTCLLSSLNAAIPPKSKWDACLVICAYWLVFVYWVSTGTPIAEVSPISGLCSQKSGGPPLVWSSRTAGITGMMPNWRTTPTPDSTI